MQSPIWISEADVAALMDMSTAVTALEEGLLLEDHGEAKNMVKTHVLWDEGSTLHAIGAVFPGRGVAGTKTWVHTQGGATPLFVLLDSKTGALKALIEAFVLGQLRTAGVSGVATKWLAKDDAETFAIIGTGKQALAQVAAVLAVRPIRQVKVYGRDSGRRADLAAQIRREFDVEAIESTTIKDAVCDAAIVTVVTRAADPILHGDMVAPGTHINSLGAIAPERAELGQSVLSRATSVVVDSIPQAAKLSRELIEFYGEDKTKWSSVQSLAQLVGSKTPRQSGTDLTVFKSLGMGISDLSLAADIYEKAMQGGIGRQFPHPQRVAPRLVATKERP